MTPAAVTVLSFAAADALILLGAVLVHLHGMRVLDRQDAAARQRYWRDQHGQNPPPVL